ncbi:hypothetical protein PR202_gb22670 [Eleusine coracana subsp. coracana]|uniref:Uncharacterized protein n=1 Tax=Eleusine coracana subsp. coracana TaxID=191504 RepID=A0AAV5FGE3_ELECO|nr:hypothetical protein PR202_gb22670 [Eleusine coracana subsp. coracana]
MAREATDDTAAREASRSAASPAPTWGRVRKAGQGAVAHALLLCFTALLALKLDGIFTRSWCMAIRRTGPGAVVLITCSSITTELPCAYATLAFRITSTFLNLSNGSSTVSFYYTTGNDEPIIDLKLVLLPLLALEIITLVDNFRYHSSFFVNTSAANFLRGTPSYARFIPIRAIFLPVILLQVAGVSFALWRFFNRLVVKLQDGTISERHLSVSSKVDELSLMIQYGSRLLYWWSIDEDSKEEQAHLCYTNDTGYSTFCSYPPEVVKEMSKKDLVKEFRSSHVDSSSKAVPVSAKAHCYCRELRRYLPPFAITGSAGWRIPRSAQSTLDRGASGTDASTEVAGTMEDASAVVDRNDLLSWAPAVTAA